VSLSTMPGTTEYAPSDAETGAPAGGAAVKSPDLAADDRPAGSLCSRTIKAGIAYFALAFGAGFVLGSIRVPFLVPRFGERVAELAEMPVMFVVILVSARFIVRRFSLPGNAAPRLGAGFLALALLLAAEVMLAVALQDRTLGEYVASRDPVSGFVYLAMLVLFAVMPLVFARADARAQAVKPPDAA
jgi:hypothetical protein